MRTLSQKFDQLVTRLGRTICWLTLAMTIATFMIVILRYGFEVSATPIRDAVVYFHGILILLGISFTLQADQHVRVDLLYSRMSDQRKRVVNLIGCLAFLIPLCIVILVVSIPYVSASWRILERSAEVDGLPGIFLFKTLLPVSAGLLLIQALNEVLKFFVDRIRPKDA